jgi:hypothetical protein
MRISLILTLALLVPVTAQGSQEPHGAAAAPHAPVAAPHASAAAPHAPRAASAPVSRTAPTSTVATVVERLQQRVAEHNVARPKPEPQPLPAPPKAPRVQLVWRLSVTWPAELTRPATAAESPAPPAPGRVRLGWMGPEP